MSTTLTPPDGYSLAWYSSAAVTIGSRSTAGRRGVADIEFEPGDHLLVSCEPRLAEVIAVDRSSVYLRCPWLVPDPESKYQRDGSIAFARDPEDCEFDRLWRLEPPPAQLRGGDSCQLSIPPIEVVVMSFARFAIPEDTGSLPRPSAVLEVRPVFSDRGDGDSGQGLYLGEADPLVIERLRRVT